MWDWWNHALFPRGRRGLWLKTLPHQMTYCYIVVYGATMTECRLRAKVEKWNKLNR